LADYLSPKGVYPHLLVVQLVDNLLVSVTGSYDNIEATSVWLIICGQIDGERCIISDKLFSLKTEVYVGGIVMITPDHTK